MSTIQIGYSRRDATPSHSVPLAGYGNTRKRMSEGYYARICTTCIAFTDRHDNTLLLYATDQIRCHREWTDIARARVSRETGIPEDHIMLTASHSHSCPDIGMEIKEDDPYFDIYMDAAVSAALEALADRVPLTLAEINRLDIPGMNFVRHYYLEDGEVAGDNYGIIGDRKAIAHTMPVDPQMQLLRLHRAGKKPVLLINWQAHPTLASTNSTDMGAAMRKLLGSDYVGLLREYTEANHDCLFAFFQGAAGNINPRSRIPEERITTNVFTYAQLLGKHLLNGLEDMTPIRLGDIQTCQQTYVGELDHSEDHMVENCKIIRKLWDETNDARLCMREGKQYGIHSTYHAGAIMRRAESGHSVSMELNAIRIGDFAFVTAPYEMFCNNAQFIKASSPFPFTFVLSCANDGLAYIASKEAFRHGCYEVDNRKFTMGTAEKVADTFVEMLKALQD